MVYTFCLGPFPMMLVSDPDTLKQIMTNKAKYYNKTCDTKKSIVRPLLGNGLLMSEGKFWEKQRSLVEPGFHFARLAAMVTDMNKAADEMIELWKEAEKNTKKGEKTVVELHHAMATVGLNTVATAVFGNSYSGRPEAAKKITDALQGCMECIRERTLISMFPVLNQLPVESLRRYYKHAGVIASEVSSIIAERRKAPHPEPLDLLDAMLNATFESKAMSAEQLQDESVNFLGAGSETTSNLMTWLVYALSERSDLWEKCQTEVENVVGDSPPTYEHLKELHFIEACAYEALRLYAPAPQIPKLAMEDHDLIIEGKKVRIKAGTQMVCHAQVVHRLEKFWPDPLSFDPYRFLLTKGEKGTLHPFAFLGFSAGPRKCLGKNFAMLEVKIVLCKIMQNYSLKVQNGQKIFPNFASQDPRHGIYVELGPRRVVGETSQAGVEREYVHVQKPVGMI